MKALLLCFCCAVLLACSKTFGGVEQSPVAAITEEFNPQRFEFAIESGFLFGAINPPANYEIAAVSVIDTNTNEAIAHIKVAPNPNWVTRNRPRAAERVL